MATNPSVQEFQEHFAYEVHYLVYAAVRFRDMGGKDKVIFQDSALMHARNLVEFTQPGPTQNGWWVGHLVSAPPATSPDLKKWTALINCNVTHMGEGRLAQRTWPVPHDDERLIALATFILDRIRDLLPASGGTPFEEAMRTITQLGLDYLKRPTSAGIDALAQLVHP